MKFELKALISGVDRLTPNLSKLEKRIEEFQKRTKKGLTESLVPSAAALAGVAKMLSSYATIEESGARLQATMMRAGGVVGEDFARINDLAKKLGSSLPGDAAAFQDMMTALKQQGVSSEAILGGVGEASAQISVMLKKLPADAANFTAKLQDSTGTAEKDMLALMDVVQRLNNVGMDPESISGAFENLSSSMDLMGVRGLDGARQLAPLVAMLDQAGMKGETAGNAMRKVISAGFNKDKVGEANSMMKSKGISLDFTDGKGNFGGLENLFTQLKKLDQLTPQGKQTILKKIFGDDAETLTALSALMRKGFQGYQEMDGKLKAQASMSERINKLMSTINAKWDTASGNITNATAAMGEALAPAVAPAIELLGNLASKFEAFATRNPEVIQSIGILVGLGVAIVSVKTALLGAAFAAKLLSISLRVSPIGVAIAALAAAVPFIISNWEPIKAFFSGIWDSISKSVMGPINTVKAIFSGLYDEIKSICDGISGLFSNISSTAASLIPGSGMLGGLVSTVTSAAKSILPQSNAPGAPAKAPAPVGIAQRAIQGQRMSMDGGVMVEFANAPPGTRATPTAPKRGQPSVSTNVGYNTLLTR